MLVVDVVETLIPRLQPLGLQLDDLLAEAAPEAVLPVSSNATLAALLTDILIIANPMVFAEMCLERIASEKYLSALVDLTLGVFLVTAPGLELVMLRIFVAFPIVFAAKRLIAHCVCAPPRPRMSLFMLLEIALSIHSLGAGTA